MIDTLVATTILATKVLAIIGIASIIGMATIEN